MIKNKTNILKELESRPCLQQVKAFIKEKVNQETWHLIDIMKSLLAHATKDNQMPVTYVYVSLEDEERSPRYSEAANKT